MAGGMAVPSVAMAVPASDSPMSDDCGKCTADEGMNAGACYAGCLGSMTGNTVVQVALGQVSAAGFGAPLPASDRFGRLVAPETGPPR
jgi:hypothetical protein